MDKETVLYPHPGGGHCRRRPSGDERTGCPHCGRMHGGAAWRQSSLPSPSPQADKVIADLAKRYADGGIILGAGTVMDAATARIAILNGAQYVVSPYFDPETVKLCNHYRVPIMPGVMTVREAVMAMEAGADILKVFPGRRVRPEDH